MNVAFTNSNRQIVLIIPLTSRTEAHVNSFALSWDCGSKLEVRTVSLRAGEREEDLELMMEVKTETFSYSADLFSSKSHFLNIYVMGQQQLSQI